MSIDPKSITVHDTQYSEETDTLPIVCSLDEDFYYHSVANITE